MPSATTPMLTSRPPSLLLRSSRDSTAIASLKLPTYEPPEESQGGSARWEYFDGVKEGEEKPDRDQWRRTPEDLSEMWHYFSKGRAVHGATFRYISKSANF
jgi:hypothetical protein